MFRGQLLHGQTVYNKTQVWYNCIVKRLALITTSLLASVAICGGVAANAEGAGGGTTDYPQYSEFTRKLVFSSLQDFAVNGDEYAFIERGEEGDIIEVHRGETLALYKFEAGESVTALDCADGTLYYSSGDKIYSLPDKKEAEHAMPEAATTVNMVGYTYNLTGTSLQIADFGNERITTLDGEYKNLKSFGGAAYAVKENALYRLDGADEELLEFTYADYSPTLEIEIGRTQTALTADYALKFVTVSAGAFMTEIDLTDLNGRYFKAGKTRTVGEDTLALLLCCTGNAAIVAIGEKSYITLKTSATETEQDCSAEPEFHNATVTGNRIYASPFVIAGTSVLFPAAGTIVKINGKIRHEALSSAFYEVEYTDAEGNTGKGYVTEGFLTEFIIEDNKPPYEIPDPNHTEKSDARTIILILLVVVLVLAAAGYITYVLTSDKRKKKNALPTDDESASTN